MQDAVTVAITDAFDQLSHKLFDHGISQAHVAAEGGAIWEDFTTSTLTDRKSLHILFEVEVQVFENEIEFVAVGMNDVQQLHDIGVVHFFQKGDFTNGRAGNAFILGLQSNLF